MMIDQKKIEKKLSAAKSYALYTCVGGSSNRLVDIVKTNGWVFNTFIRYHFFGEYRKSYEHFTAGDITANLLFDDETHQLKYKTKGWYYHPYDLQAAIRVYLYCLDLKQHPLDEKNLRDHHIDESHTFYIFDRVIMARERRVDNCGARSALAIEYLWRHPEGIKRIELFSAKSFDHVWVVVNRVGDEKNPQTWGEDCWCIDPWYATEEKEGIIFPGTEFKTRIKEIKEFAKVQCREREKLGLDNAKISEGCDFIICTSFDVELPIHSNASYVYYPLLNEIYYLNKTQGEYYPLALSNDMLKQFNRAMSQSLNIIPNQSIQLTEDMLNFISSITGHHHYEEVGEIVCKVEPSFNIYPTIPLPLEDTEDNISHPRPLEDYYLLVNSYFPLKSLFKQNPENDNDINIISSLKEDYNKHVIHSYAYREQIKTLKPSNISLSILNDHTENMDEELEQDKVCEKLVANFSMYPTKKRKAEMTEDVSNKKFKFNF